MAKNSQGKRAKSGTTAPGNAKWDVTLQTTPFEEEYWRPNVTLIVGNRVDDYKHIDILTSIVNSGIRRLYTIVTRESLYNEARELGNPKNKKPKDNPPNYEVCEPVKVHLDAGEEVPLPLQAKLIKYKMLITKTADVKRREVDKKLGLDKGKGGKGKGADKAREKSPAKKGGKKTPEPSSAKEGSKLKKRGEDDDDNKFVDDEPDDGAHFYFLLVGFNNPHLLQFLSEVGINVNCVIRILSQDYSRFAPLVSDSASDKEKDEKTLAAEEATRLERYKQAQELNMFWKDVIYLLRNNPDNSPLHQVARLDYEIKNLLLPVSFEDMEQKNQFATAMFEDISCMIYDLQDANRLYHTYLQNLKLINVPVTSEKQVEKPALDGQSTGAPATPAVPAVPVSSGSAMEVSGADNIGPPDMRYYNDLMNCVPHESVSVPLIIHCMLEQVAASEESRDPPSEQVPVPRMDGLSGKVADHLSSIAFKLALSEDEHKALSAVLELPQRPPEEPKPPILMNVHDDISIRTHHLKSLYDLHPEEVERQMLKLFPLAEHCRPERPSSAVCRARAARLQELIHFCATNGLSPSEIDRAFKQFVFESIDLAGTDSNGFLITRDVEGVRHSSIPWDDPYPFFKGMIPHEEKMSKIDILESPDDTDRSGAKTPPVGEEAQGRPISMPRKGDHPSNEHSARSVSRTSSAESKKGILRSRSNTPARSRSRSNSVVHFDVPSDHKLDQEAAADAIMESMEAEGEKSMEDTLMEVVQAQKRILDQWCFAEHYEPHVLLQVVRDAIYDLPFVETYEHKRDQSMMLVLHNPYNNELQNHVDWHTEMHSNVGFRNYLENVAESLADWLKEKEAEYQAHLLSAEVDKINQEEEEPKPGDKKGKGGKAAAGRKSARSKSPKGTNSRSNSTESLPGSNPYIRPNSLKAWKEDQERTAREEAEAAKAKEKKGKSPPPKKKKDDDEEKKPGSRSSSKSKLSVVKPPDELLAEELKAAAAKEEEETYWPFTGYDTGNQLLHVSGITTSLFPSDGGQIRSERTEFVQGTTAVRTTVLKDGHVFAVHVINPKEPEEESDDPDLERPPAPKTDEQPEKAEFEKSEKDEKENLEKKPTPVSQFGSMTASLVDGMVLSLSQFGPHGELPEGKPYEPSQYVPVIPPAASPVPVPHVPSPAKAEKKKGGKGAPTPEPPPVVEDELVEEKEEPKVYKQTFQEVYVTCPDGLQVRYYLQSSLGVLPNAPDDRHLVVKQSYPFKTSCSQDCESSRRKYVQSETSRVMTADGTIIKNMVDGSVEVLYADSMVATFTGYWPMPSSRSSSPQRGGSARSINVTGEQRAETPTKKTSSRSAKGAKQEKPQAPVEPPPPEVTQVAEEHENEQQPKCGSWTVTYPNGERVRTTQGQPAEELKPIMICVASDPDTKQTMATRDDKVITVSYPDGTTVVEHSDGTRITVYYRDTQVPVGEDRHTGEPQDMMTQTLKFVKIECPAYATVEFNCATSENLTVFGSGTSVNVFPDGYYIVHHARGGRIEIDTEGSMVYYPRPMKNMEQLLPERDLQYVMRHNADVIVETVDPEGNVFNVKSSGDFCVLPSNAGDELSDNSDEQQNNLSGEKKLIRFGQHAPRFFLVHSDGSGTELLRYQDIAEYLTSAERNPATAVLKEPLPEYPGVIGMTILKPYIGGLSQRWMKGYDQASIIPNGIRSRDLTTLPAKEYKKPGARFGTNVGQGMSVGAAIKTQSRVPILKCPVALELRQFVQYKPVSEDMRERLRMGLKEYAMYVMERNRLDSLMAVQDPRTDEEKMLAADLLATAVSQRPEPIEADYIKNMYETAIAPPPPSPPATPQPKRTQADWERDQRELAEESEGRAMLRGKKIPTYFDSEMGKSFLLTQAKDMDELLKELSEDPRRDGTEAIRADTSFEPSSYPASRQLFSQPGMSAMSDRSAVESDSPTTMARGKLPPDTPMSFGGGAMSEMNAATPSGLRPGNPTPAHAGGQGSPAPVRPKNPTPAKANKVVADRPVNPTPKMAGGYSETPSEFETYLRGEYPMIPEAPMEEERGCLDFAENEADMLITPSLKVSVTGDPRSMPVPLPNSIMGGRPNANPNVRYATIEDPVRRRVKNPHSTGVTFYGNRELRRMQGLNVFPEEVNFGVLREGSTYAFLVQLKNTGVDSCRFKVKQPPPATGMRVIYKPGPVAAGMKSDLRLELYAIAVGVEGETGVGTISHPLEIVTETDVLCVPIQATVMTSYEYDQRNSSSPTVRHAPGAVLISNKPPASTGIIRPRKEIVVGGP